MKGNKKLQGGEENRRGEGVEWGVKIQRKGYFPFVPLGLFTDLFRGKEVERIVF